MRSSTWLPAGSPRAPPPPGSPPPPRGAGCDLLPGCRRDRLGRAAPRVPAAPDRVRPVPALGHSRCLAADPRRPPRPGSAARRPGARTDRGDHRLAIGARRRHRSHHKPRYDAGKKVNGRKRHIAVDTNGLLLAVVVTIAAIQDRDAGLRLLGALRARFSTISLVWADAGYAGRLVTWAGTVLHLVVEIVKRCDDLTGFHVLPRRWVVERTFAWISKRRRCVRDYETLPEHHEAMVHIAMIMTMSRRLARTT